MNVVFVIPYGSRTETGKSLHIWRATTERIETLKQDSIPGRVRLIKGIEGFFDEEQAEQKWVLNASDESSLFTLFQDENDNIDKKREKLEVLNFSRLVYNDWIQYLVSIGSTSTGTNGIEIETTRLSSYVIRNSRSGQFRIIPDSCLKRDFGPDHLVIDFSGTYIYFLDRANQVTRLTLLDGTRMSIPGGDIPVIPLNAQSVYTLDSKSGVLYRIAGDKILNTINLTRIFRVFNAIEVDDDALMISCEIDKPKSYYSSSKSSVILVDLVNGTYKVLFQAPYVLYLIGYEVSSAIK